MSLSGSFFSASPASLRVGAALAAVLALSPLAASAQPAEPLLSSLSALVVGKDAAGAETLAPAQEAAPGDVVEYRLSYTNVSPASISGVVVTGPIPDSMSYVADSAFAPGGARMEVSVDNGESWEREPVRRLRQNAQGQTVEVIVPASEYTHVRWVGSAPLQPSQSIQYTYRAQVN